MLFECAAQRHQCVRKVYVEIRVSARVRKSARAHNVADCEVTSTVEIHSERFRLTRWDGETAAAG